MEEMSQNELKAIVNDAKTDVVKDQGDFIKQNEKFLRYYMGEPFGNEVEGESSVISTDVADVVDSDMPSLVRIFLGSQDIMKFEPNTSSERDISEAEEKTEYINWIVRNQADSFKTIFDWMKDAEIQKCGVVNFEYCEDERVKELEYDGLSSDELTVLMEDLTTDDNIDSIEVVGQNMDSEDGIYVRFKITQEVKDFKINNIETENFLLSRNATSLEDAELVGHISYPSRGDLIAAGFDEDIVRRLPGKEESDKQSNMKEIRFKGQGGDLNDDPIQHWASVEVQLYTLYLRVDFDGDGIPERRKILMAGNEILENEQFEIVPYAILSSILMPNSVIGRSRAEITVQTQLVKSTLFRQSLNNIYRVNSGRVVINDEVTNIDDLLTNRANGGVVRTDSVDPRMAVAQLETPYIGDKALQIIQYVDSVNAKSTGNQLSNQGLDADKLYNETATRFQGIQDSGAAKIELVARGFAETGFKQLYNGLAWMVSHYQNSKKEIMVLGKPITVDPRMWRHNHSITSNVGLASGDDEDTVNNMAALLSIHEQLKARGSSLTDDAKIYNVLKKVVNSMGIERVDEVFNNVERPDEILLAQNEQLMGMVEQLQAQVQNNPLAEAEKVGAQAKLIEAQGKAEIELLKIKEQMRQFSEKMNFDYTKLELEESTNIPGQGLNG